ncbi:MAG TPA: peptidoglycan DD-metalloendopeptidase family protein [Candidatus Acidoferrales bacterium]|nr:peptidoglycan DD-metalloendopeptidase family protein [Candidatus Acidoferrales bacterium]
MIERPFGAPKGAPLQFFVALVLAIVTIAPIARAATPEPITQKILEKRALIEQTERRLHQSRLKLHAARFKEMTISQEVEEVQESIARVQGDLGALDGALRQTELRLFIRQRQLAAARASLDLHRDALNRRIVDVYEYGSAASYLNVLLSATSFIDFVERWDFVRAILESDAQLIDVVNDEAANEQRLVGALQAAQADLEREQAEAQARQQQLGALALERRNLLAVAAAQRSVIAQQVYELEGLSAAEEARLQALIQEKQREDEAITMRARYEACQARRAAAEASGLSPPACNLGGPVEFQWPVRGPITSPFGMRVDPITGRYALHSGIDIGADYGTPIQAAADGTVIFASWYGGYGNAIIIDHGSGLSTLYAHCSAMYVTVNQLVQRGQVIGAVGMTGYATGPHLHFEIRVNGVPINPLTRL